MTEARIASLHVYPVKGCRGLALPQADVAVTGLGTANVLDREWMVTDPDGLLVTQREVPELALVDVAISDAALILTAPRAKPLRVPLQAAGAQRRAVTVWHSTVQGIDAGDAAAAWLSAWLRTPVRLHRFDRSGTRACNPDYAGDSGAHTLFADGYPLLIVGSASLADLNARLESRGIAALPMDRFRPNIVLDGLPAYDEDHVDTIAIGGALLKCVKPCVRCQVTTTDQATAHTGLEPLRTLGQYRMNEGLGGVTFGMNAIVVGGAGSTVAVGAPAVVEYRF